MMMRIGVIWGLLFFVTHPIMAATIAHIGSGGSLGLGQAHLDRLENMGHTTVEVGMGELTADFLSGVDGFYGGRSSFGSTQAAALEEFVKQGGFAYYVYDLVSPSVNVLSPFGISVSSNNQGYGGNTTIDAVGSSKWVTTPNLMTTYSGGGALYSKVSSSNSDFVVLGNSQSQGTTVFGVLEPNEAEGRLGGLAISGDAEMQLSTSANNLDLWENMWHHGLALNSGGTSEDSGDTPEDTSGESSAVPEPSSLVLTLVALLAVCCWQRAS